MAPPTIRPVRPDEQEALVDIWLRAVRATHDFLTEEDIQGLLALVRDPALLEAVELWVVEDGSGAPAGWMGLSGAKVEALFVAPEHHRRGLGRALLAHAAAQHPELTVDVNEQNPGARRFYEALGFEVEGRSELDDHGLPFPLLHLRRPAQPWS